MDHSDLIQGFKGVWCDECGDELAHEEDDGRVDVVPCSKCCDAAAGEGLAEGQLRAREAKPHQRPDQAQCPSCGTWSDVEWQSELPPGGFWWKGGHGTCPACDAIVLVESECNFRRRPEHELQTHEHLTCATSPTYLRSLTEEKQRDGWQLAGCAAYARDGILAVFKRQVPR